MRALAAWAGFDRGLVFGEDAGLGEDVDVGGRSPEPGRLVAVQRR